MTRPATDSQQRLGSRGPCLKDPPRLSSARTKSTLDRHDGDIVAATLTLEVSAQGLKLRPGSGSSSSSGSSDQTSEAFAAMPGVGGSQKLEALRQLIAE